jgi:Membrane iron-sulfur containing protein FtrD-like
MNRRVVVILFVAAATLVGASAGFAGGKILPNGDLQIQKKEITATAKFYQYKLDGVLMEVLALRAPDGTVRTAFNTCQVCYSSGRGYYIQQGDVLVCQNCHNRFKASQVEIIKGGCNPLPITADLKAEDAGTITIAKSLFAEAKPIFQNWKTR